MCGTAADRPGRRGRCHVRCRRGPRQAREERRSDGGGRARRRRHWGQPGGASGFRLCLQVVPRRRAGFGPGTGTAPHPLDGGPQDPHRQVGSSPHPSTLPSLARLISPDVDLMARTEKGVLRSPGTRGPPCPTFPGVRGEGTVKPALRLRAELAPRRRRRDRLLLPQPLEPGLPLATQRGGSCPGLPPAPWGGCRCPSARCAGGSPGVRFCSSEAPHAEAVGRSFFWTP